MLKHLKLNLEAIEAIYYFWVAVTDRENVSEQFFHDIGQMEAMTNIYDEEFDSESVRRALSAIKNREPFSGNKKEQKFWNLNYWAMEDFGITDMMIQPLKKMVIGDVLSQVEADKVPHEDVEVIVSPMHFDEYRIVGNKLLINFFRIKVDFSDESVNIDGKSIDQYIAEKLNEMK